MSELHYACELWTPTVSLKALPDSYLWAQQLLGMINLVKNQVQPFYKDHLPTAPLSGAVFSGAAGNGRHTTAEALSLSLANQHKNANILHLRLRGAFLDFEQPDTALKALASLRDAFRSADGMCLLLDEPQDCRHSRMLQSHLLMLRSAFRREFPNKPFYLIIVTDSADSVLSGLLRELPLLPCAAPTADERRAWLSAQLRSKIKKINGEISMADLAAETEGFSWYQLQQLRSYLQSQVFVNAQQLAEQQKEEVTAAANALTKNDVTRALAKHRIHLIKSGDATPDLSQLEPLLHALKAQLPVQQSALPYIQAVPVQAAAAAVPATAAPATSAAEVRESIDEEESSFDKNDNLAQQEKHGNPDAMSGDEFIFSLGHRLKLPDLSTLETELPET